MFHRSLIVSIALTLFSHFVWAQLPCPQVIGEIATENMETLLKLAPNYCMSKYQNFEFENGVDGYCDCQLKQKDEIPAREFISNEKKLKEVGDAFFDELLSISKVISEISNEYTQEDLEKIGVRYPEKCNLPDFLSEENLSCDGKKIPDEYLQKVFSSMNDDIPSVLSSEFDIKKDEKFSPRNLSKKIQKTIEILNGESHALGDSKKCLPPKYDSAITKSSALYSVIPQTVGEFDSSLVNPEILNKFSQDDPEIKKSLITKAFSIIENRCTDIKKNINKSLCGKPEELKLPIKNSNIEDLLIATSLDSVKIDTDIVGRLKSACLQKDNVLSDFENLNTKVIHNIVPRLQDINISAEANFKITLDGLVDYTEGFAEKELCKEICTTSGPYKKSGCEFRNISEIDQKFCLGDSKKLTQEQGMICSFVEIEKINQSKSEIIKAMAHLSDEEVESYIESNFKGEERKSITSMVKVDRTTKSGKSIKNLFFKEREVETKKVATSNEDLAPKETISRENREVRVSRSIIKEEDKIMAQSAPAPREKAPLAPSSFSMQSSSSSSALETVKKAENSLGAKQASKAITYKPRELEADIAARMKDTKKLSELTDRITKSQQRISSMMKDIQENQENKEAENSGTNYSSPRNNIPQRIYPISEVMPNYEAQRKTIAANTGKNNEPATGVVENSRSPAATDTRGLSNISKLFLGELDKQSVSVSSSNISELQRVLIPSQLDKIDLVTLLSTKDEIRPGDPFILFEIKNGVKSEVTLVPTYSEYNQKKSFTGYKAININASNRYLVDKIKSHQNLIRD